MTKIQVVEDDANIRELVLYALQSAGFDAVGYEQSADFWRGVQKDVPDLLLLDIMLPGESGLELLRKLRQDKSTRHLPVILVSAKGSEYDKVKGLDLGADDYVTKPFSVLELISRVRSVLRRSGVVKSEELLTARGVTLDKERHIVLVDNEQIILTYKEFELLHFLLLNKGIVMSRERIMNAIWDYDFEVESRTVDMHIKTVRQKLGKAGEQIKTVRGIGYKIEE